MTTAARSRTRSGLRSAFVALAIATLPLIGCGSSAGGSSENSSGDQSEPSIEYKLAAIDGIGEPTEADLAPYGAALDRLRRKCRNTRQELSDYTVRSQELLRKNGSPESSLLTILKGIGGSIPRDYPRRDCSELFAAFVTLSRPQ